MYLIERFGSDAGKKAGEFYTPARVRELVAKLAAPEPGNTICDPTCGSGSLLFDVARVLGDNNNYRLYGQEKNGSTLALAKMNMFLHGIDDAVLEWGDTISNPRLLEAGKLMKLTVWSPIRPSASLNGGLMTLLVIHLAASHAASRQSPRVIGLLCCT